MWSNTQVKKQNITPSSAWCPFLVINILRGATLLASGFWHHKLALPGFELQGRSVRWCVCCLVSDFFPSVMFMKFICRVVYSNTFGGMQYFILRIPLFIHSTVDGHLSCFPFLSVMHEGNFLVCVSGGQMCTLGFPRWLTGKESTCQGRRSRICGFSPWVGKIPWRRKQQSTPIFFPGNSHGQRSLAGYSPRGRKELDTTEQLNSKSSMSALLLEQNCWVIRYV